MDSYPGGFYPVTFNLSDSNASQSNWFFQLNVTGRNADSFNFIPTPSALDVGSGSSPLFDNDYKEKYNAEMPPVGSRAIPFHNFTTSFDLSGNNEAHISFNTRNGDWLALELNIIQNDEELFDCTATCDIQNWEIQGPDTFCGTSTYSLPVGVANYNWTFPGVRTTSPGSPNVVSLQEWNNGYQTISATINLPECGLSRVITKTVYVGVPRTGGNLIEVDPNMMLSIYPSGSFCSTTGVQIINWPDLEQVQETQMRKVSGQSYWDGEMRNGGRNFSAAIFSNCNELFEFEVRARNSCGWSEWEHFSVPTTGCMQNCTGQTNGNIVSSNFVISPVPANTVLAIDMVQDPAWTFYTLGCSDGIFDTGFEGNTDCPTYVGVQLYDFTGTMVMNIPSHQLGRSFDVSALTAGTYLLRISHGNNQPETHQIPIN